MKTSPFLLITLLVLFTNSTARAQSGRNHEQNIWPDIKHYLDQKEKTSLAGAAVLLVRVVQWNGLPKSTNDKKLIFIPSTALTQWKDGRYGVVGLTRTEIATCRTTPNSHGPTNALLPSVSDQLTCYGIVVSLCMGMRLPEWYVASNFLNENEKSRLEWAVRFVLAHNACATCPCRPPLPPGLIWAPPEVEAEIVCIGDSCKR